MMKISFIATVILLICICSSENCMVSRCYRCSITGAEVFGGDLSLEECKQKCLDHQDCKGIDFDKRARERARVGKCFLKLEQSQNYVETSKFDAWSLKRNCTDSDLIRLTEVFRGADNFYRIQRSNNGHGFLQMKMGLMKEWYTVNAEGFGLSELAVVCHQLGFSRNGAHTKEALYLSPGLFKQDKFINNVHCGGSEQKLQDCSYDWFLLTHDQGGRKGIEVKCAVEIVDVIASVTGVTDSNKDTICDGFAKAVGGYIAYCSLSGPEMERRKLTTSTDLFMRITVSDASVAVATMNADKFKEKVALPSSVTVTSLSAKKGTSKSPTIIPTLDIEIETNTNYSEDSTEDFFDSSLSIILVSILVFLFIISLVSVCLYKHAQQKGKVMDLESIQKSISDFGNSDLKDIESPYVEKTLSANLESSELKDTESPSVEKTLTNPGSSEMNDVECGAGSVEKSH